MATVVVYSSYLLVPTPRPKDVIEVDPAKEENKVKDNIKINLDFLF